MMNNFKHYNLKKINKNNAIQIKLILLIIRKQLKKIKVKFVRRQ